MGCCVKFAVHGSGPDHSCASALSPDAGELSHAAVVRFRLWLATAFELGVIVGSVLRAQVSDEETGRGEQSVKKRHKAHSFSPAPEKSPSPIAKAKPVSSKSKEETDTSPAPEKSPSPIAKATKKSGEEETVP